MMSDCDTVCTLEIFTAGYYNIAHVYIIFHFNV